MRISKKIGACLCFIIIFILIILCFSFALRPYSGSGSEMWQGFARKAPIDLIYTGTSFCLCDVNPALVDEQTGLKSFNMGTNMQSIQSSYIALQQAIKRGGITKAVVGVDPEIMEMDRQSNFRAEACFVRNLSDTLPLTQRPGVDLSFVTSKDFIGTPTSVLYYVPWTYDRVSNISGNIKEKLQNQILDATDHRDENGYYGSDEIFGEGRNQVDITNVLEWNEKNDDLYDIEIVKYNLTTLEDIAKLCQKENIELYVIAYPTTQALAIYNLESYKAFSDTIKETLSPYGYTYHDFNLIKPEYVDITELSLFRDNGHMNNAGSAQFSKALGIMINKSENGEDVDSMFNVLP